MFNIKKAAAFLTALSLCASLSGCGGNEFSSGASGEGTEASQETKQSRAELSDEQKTAASEAGISEERYCTDNEAITARASEIIDIYYQGITDVDFDRCFEVFPDFYKKAMEEENRKYNETNEQYTEGMKKYFSENYGEDFYVFSEVTSVLQISDSSLAELETRIKNTFGTEMKIDDLYYVYFKQVVRGSLKKGSDPLEFCLIYSDGKYYLYDDYFEKS